MRIADLPAEDDADGILEFVRSFNGYAFHGSFEACAEAAAQAKRETLESIRNELFFFWRASVHQGSGDGGVIELYRQLRPLLAERLDRSAR